MLTPNDAITSAFRKLGIKPAETTLEPEELNDGLEVLNDLGAEHLWFPPVENLSDELRIPRSAEGPFKTLLAKAISVEYPSVTISPVLQLEFGEAQKSMWRIINVGLRVRLPNTLPKGSGNLDCDFILERLFFRQQKVNF